MTGTAAALTFVWLGMILAISFLEAPLKFRAPGVTIPIGLQIGRLVFRALNGVELILAIAVVTLVAVGPGGGVLVVAVVAPVSLLIQVGVIRPRLSRRTVRVLAGEAGPRSHAHIAYVAVEIVKVAALITAGVLLTSAAP